MYVMRCKSGKREMSVKRRGRRRRVREEISSREGGRRRRTRSVIQNSEQTEDTS